MAQKKTPGVYVEEISTLPPSVAEVSTAIPVFIGYTQKAPKAEWPQVERIDTLLEYEDLFGKAKPTGFTVTTKVDAETEETVVEKIEYSSNGASHKPEFLMHYCVSMYFKNGGGSCYIISIGEYDDTKPTLDDFDKGLKLLEKEDEPTLIVLTDAVNLSETDYPAVCKQAMALCDKLKDRFTILDVPGGEDDEKVKKFRTDIGMSGLMYAAAYVPYLNTSLNFQYKEDGIQIKGSEDTTLDQAKSEKTALYNQVKAAMAKQKVTLPPSAAVAGVYARVDRNRGVWKAPANESLFAVVGPISKITHTDQETLNVDPTAGKSINAIRTFTGKGTLIWGARTLAGNDNEWRYISVRRLFNMIEESTKKATSFAVFEPNDATTWLKVKGMIESYLYGLWERGAFFGSTPEKAYFVNVGLGTTMTAQDILEGRMIVEIGIAAVRPAEFIIIRFMHKMPEA